MFLTVQATVAPASTTFADLFFSSNYSPWGLVGISLFAAVVGMFTHWAKVHFKEHAQISMYEWFFVLNKVGTLFALMGMLGALFVAFAPLDYTTITAYQAVSQAWAIGYAADSMFNSSETKQAAELVNQAKALVDAEVEAETQAGGLNG